MSRAGDDLIVGMAGSGGDGVVSAGEALIAAAARSGYYGIMTKSFGSQIRGGESSCRVRVSPRPVPNPGGVLDVAVVLSFEDFLKFGAELPVSGRTVVVHDAREAAPRALGSGVTPAEVVGVPIGDVARRVAGTDRAKNSVVLGLLAGWFGFPEGELREGVRRMLAGKGEAVVAANDAAFSAGLELAASRPLASARVLTPVAAPDHPRLLADGNQMCAAAAVFAGCEFFGGYPITPSSEIMHELSRDLWTHGGILLQAEDEIAGLGAVIGASFAGRKAMTATSGPGMSLKTELLGLATMAELPLVCVNVQRGGPSTGLPTKTEQSDLWQAAFSAHGDAVRPVLAPVGVPDTFATTVQAFNIAEAFQTPVVLLSDQEIAQRKEIADPIDLDALPIVSRRTPSPADLQDYVRFRNVESGVSPISRPGQPGGSYLASGIEHNEYGAPTAGGAVHARMNDKRIRKLDPLKRRADLFETAGDPHALLAVVSWGSVGGVAREALALAEAAGLHAKLLLPRLLYPVAEAVYAEFFAGVRAGLVVEQSHLGQLFRLLRMFVDVPHGIASLARSGANPISPGEIVDRLHGLSLDLQREREPEPALG